MDLRRATAGALTGLLTGLLAGLLAGCGAPTGSPPSDRPVTLPVGPTRWDATAPAWLLDGTLHVGDRTVELDRQVDEFLLGATGVYWSSAGTFLFTSAEGDTEQVRALGEAEMAVSADRSVLAVVDDTRGPTDDYGTHVRQVSAFDTRTGERLYRTPDREPREGDDLADLYEETTPLLHGVGDGLLFFDDTTIRLADGSLVPARDDPEGGRVYDGYAATLFPDGFHVSLRGEGRRREVAGSSVSTSGRLSPDRSTVFDQGVWPTAAVAYDARTGRRRPIDGPWRHIVLTAWSDADTFFGVAQQIDLDHPQDVVRARQVVTCELRSLACTPVSPVLPTTDETGEGPVLLVEGADTPL